MRSQEVQQPHGRLGEPDSGGSLLNTQTQPCLESTQAGILARMEVVDGGVDVDAQPRPWPAAS
jgi:hypothetical protein